LPPFHLKPVSAWTQIGISDEFVRFTLVIFPILAYLAKLPTGLYILLALISIFFSFFFFFFILFNDFSKKKLSQDPLDLFSHSFHRLKAFLVQMIDLDLVFR